jgi:hypothetical protein
MKSIKVLFVMGHGILVHGRRHKISLIVTGCIKSSGSQMVQLNGTKLNWLQKGSSNDMVWIMKIHLVQLLNP